MDKNGFCGHMHYSNVMYEMLKAKNMRIKNLHTEKLSLYTVGYIYNRCVGTIL